MNRDVWDDLIDAVILFTVPLWAIPYLMVMGIIGMVRGVIQFGEAWQEIESAFKEARDN